MGVLDHPLITAFDRRIDALVERRRGNRLVDRAFYAASEAANHSMVWHALAWAPVLGDRARWRRAVVVSTILGIESGLVNGPVKMLFRRERPEHVDARPHRLRTPRTSSFPSGHATSAMCAAILLSDGRKRRWGIFALAGAVASSRVYVRIHHASDVIGGLVFGTGFGLLARRALRRCCTSR